jgi:hypothetical protein
MPVETDQGSDHRRPGRLKDLRLFSCEQDQP